MYIDVVTIADVPDNYDERSASSNGTTPMIAATYSGLTATATLTVAQPAVTSITVQ